MKRTPREDSRPRRQRQATPQQPESEAPDPFVSLGSVESLTAGVDGMDKESDGRWYVPRALCPQCSGAGKITPCPKCLGSGYLEGGATCHICDGRGSVTCPRCSGSGWA